MQNHNYPPNQTPYPPGPPPPPPDLPHPWTMHHDQSGKAYYYNPENKTTQWDRPTANPQPPPPPPPSQPSPESFPSYPIPYHPNSQFQQGSSYPNPSASQPFATPGSQPPPQHRPSNLYPPAAQQQPYPPPNQLPQQQPYPSAIQPGQQQPYQSGNQPGPQQPSHRPPSQPGPQQPIHQPGSQPDSQQPLLPPGSQPGPPQPVHLPPGQPAQQPPYPPGSQPGQPQPPYQNTNRPPQPSYPPNVNQPGPHHIHSQPNYPPGIPSQDPHGYPPYDPSNNQLGRPQSSSGPFIPSNPSSMPLNSQPFPPGSVPPSMPPLGTPFIPGKPTHPPQNQMPYPGKDSPGQQPPNNPSLYPPNIGSIHDHDPVSGLYPGVPSSSPHQIGSQPPTTAPYNLPPAPDHTQQHPPSIPTGSKPPAGYPANPVNRPPVQQPSYPAGPPPGPPRPIHHMPSYPGSVQSGQSYQLSHGLSAGGANQSALLGGMEQLSMGPTGSSSGTYINLEFRAVGLRDRDIIGSSDPICYVSVPDEPANMATTSDPSKIARWKVIGSTEILDNTTSPNWATRVKVPYYFERHQPMRFVLVDVDNRKHPMKGDKLGFCATTLAEIVRNSTLTRPLSADGKKKSSKKMGSLTILAHDDEAAGKVRLQLSLAASNLDKMDLLSKSDPFYELKQVVGSGSSGTSMIHKSEHIDNECNPTWVPHTSYIAVGNTPWSDVQLSVAVYDWNKYKAPALIGEVNFSLADLTTRKSFPLINHRKKSRKYYKNSGILIIHRADAVQLPSFVSYIQGGLRLNFIVAVDFTASNKRPTNPDSLHYNGDPSRPSQYAQALSAVGNTLLSYIPDGQMTALGFGAKLPGQGQETSFDFALTGEPDPRVFGIDGLLSAYYQAVDNVTFSSPTNFTPLLRNAMSICSGTPVSQNCQHFSVLMILTDGIVTDLTSTIDAIIDASYNTPIAIVIVGIGNANFSAMERLDGDNTRLRNDKTGREAKHDIVQFTKFSQGMNFDDFSRKVLHEVPKRVVEYMVDAKIQPNSFM